MVVVDFLSAAMPNVHVLNCTTEREECSYAPVLYSTVCCVVCYVE